MANGGILTIVEPQIHPQRVVERATWLAERTGKNLTLLLCDADVTALASGFFVSAETKSIADEMRLAQREILEDLAEPVRERGIKPRLEVLDERPVAEGIIARALDMEPDYVLKGTRYHSEAQRSIFVDTDWHLVRVCPYPLWLVKPQDISEEPCIIAAVDPTHGDDEPAHVDRLIVKEALAVARKTHGEVHLLHTYQPLRGIGAEATRTFKPIRIPIEDLSKKMEQDHRQKLELLAETMGIAGERVHQLAGSPGEVLPWFTRDRNADLIVMGSIARWSLQRAVVGSTAENVMDHLPCDILVVRAVSGKGSS
ncbi:MAG: universal stress protein [Woeseia sp.]